MRVLRWILCFACVLLLAICAQAADNPQPTAIVMLGTGSPRPIPDRSGPATAIVVGDRAYLVDLGAGVVRRAAAAALKGISPLNPVNLSLAFLTHLHSDHTIGYPDLIFTPWVMGRTELSVYGPRGTEAMTRHILEAWREDIAIRTTGGEGRRPLLVHAHDVKPGIVYRDDRVTVTAFLVRHGKWRQAFGYRFDTPGRSIVISGDTSPSDEVIRQCSGCDVLIHEAYSPNAPPPPMANWPAYSAAYHTSTVELAKIAAAARPRLLILYHQSGRVPDGQLLEEIQRTYHGKVVVAHDLDIY